MNELAAAQAQGAQSGELPAELRDYLSFTAALHQKLQQAGTEDLRSKVNQRLVNKIEIQPNGFRLHYFAGESHVPRPSESAPEIDVRAIRPPPEFFPTGAFFHFEWFEIY